MTDQTKTRRPRRMAREPEADEAVQGLQITEEANKQQGSAAAESQTKAGRLIAMLQREGGASLDEMVAELGWLPHTTRAALTGLRKKGHAIGKGKVDGVTRYSIAPAPAQ